MCLDLVFHLVTFAFECDVSRTEIQLLTSGLGHCVLNWCKIILNG